MSINPESFYPDLVKDYFSGVLTGNNILNFQYQEGQLKERLTSRKFQERTTLSEVLNKQYTGLQKSNALIDNLEALKKDNTFTVCTGHQLSLFGGPSFFFTKIIEVIKLAEDLNRKHTKSHIVPVFWMASEDHDFEEISKVQLFNEVFNWEDKAQGMVGEISCKSLQNILQDFCAKIGQGEKAEKVISILQKAYIQQNNLSQATRILVNEFFGDLGLVIIDGHDTALKKLLIPTLEQEFTAQTTHQRVGEQILKLEGYKIQANPREINVFYLLPNYRVRIEKDGKHFKTIDGVNQWTMEELLIEVNSNPEKFSPNVFLRPVYQELCLPNIAYIGGAGEIAYWLELPLLFHALNIPFPLPVVRNSFIYLIEKQISQITELGLKLEDFFKREDLLINEFITQNSNNAIELEEELKELEKLFTSISTKAIQIDSNLSKVVAGEQKRVQNGMENLQKRFRNAEKNNFEQKINQIKNFKSKIFPDGIFQERQLSFLEFYLKSDQDLIQRVLDQTTPLENSLKVIRV